MNYTQDGRAPQPTRACTGCESRNLGPLSASVTAPTNGRIRYVCRKCTRRALLSADFRKRIELAVLAGSTIPELDRVFRKLGLDAAPTTADECRRAVFGGAA